MARAEAGQTAATWARRVAELEQSGLSVRKFAAREGLKAGSLAFWKWKLSQPAGEAPRVAPLKFVELTAERASEPTAAAAFEVTLRSGRTVWVPHGFDAGELARLVELLEEPSP